MVPLIPIVFLCHPCLTFHFLYCSVLHLTPDHLLALICCHLVLHQQKIIAEMASVKQKVDVKIKEQFQRWVCCVPVNVW